MSHPSASNASTSPALRPGGSLYCGAESAPHRATGAFEVPIEPDSRRFADQVVLGHEAPDPTILTVVPVVAHHEVASGRNGGLECRPLTGRGVGRRTVVGPAIVASRLIAVAA